MTTSASADVLPERGSQVDFMADFQVC